MTLTGSWFPEAFVGPMANLQCYAEGSEPVLHTSVEDVSKTMACAEAAYRSDATGAESIPMNGYEQKEIRNEENRCKQAVLAVGALRGIPKGSG